MEKMKLYPNAQIDKRIDALAKSGQKMQNEMHKIGCSVLRRLGENGDVRQVLRFILAMPDMARTNGLRAWFEKHGPVKFVQNGEGAAAYESVVFVKDKPVLLGDAMAKPFWKFNANEGAPYKPIVWDEYLDMQIKKLAKDIDQVKVEDGTADPRRDLLNAMRTMRNAKAPAQTVQSGDVLAN